LEIKKAKERSEEVMEFPQRIFNEHLRVFVLEEKVLVKETFVG
jgi:hypothetical protein